jgi:glycosyltransferase involved in cell wall biosynthesis
MRVCHLTSGHRPDDDRIYFKEARSLARRFSDLWLISPYPQSVPKAERTIRFRTFDACKGASGRRRNILTLREAGLGLNPALIHCHEPESLLAALWIKRRTGCKVIFDSHEDWGATFAQRFPPPLWRPLWAAYHKVEKHWLKNCDAAIGASWAITERLAGILADKPVATILNVPVAEVFGGQPTRTWDRETFLCHDGHLTFDRGLRTMAEAVRLVARKHPIKLKIVGDVFGGERDWLEAFISTHRLESTIMKTGWIDYTGVGRELALCHIGLIALQRTPNNIVTSSNKVFNYMLYGIPFVGPDFRLSKIKLSQEEGCGLLADSRSAADYAEKICWMIEHRTETVAMGRRALEASRTKYRWERMEPVLFRLYDAVLACGRPGAGG